MDPKGVSIDSKANCNVRKSVTGILEMEHLIYSIVKEISKLIEHIATNLNKWSMVLFGELLVGETDSVSII